MSDYGLFWNSRAGDRTYSADDFSDWLATFFTNGVYNGDLFVSASEGMDIEVATGYANINGKVILYKEPHTLTVPAASGAYDRTDSVVIERNEIDRTFYLKIVSGGANGEPPAVERSETVYQLVIAHIAVSRSAIRITQANITDTRMDDNLCGWIIGTVENIDFGQITAQWEQYIVEFQETEVADWENWEQQQEEDWSDWSTLQRQRFADWFENISYVLDGDAAGHLQAEIDDLKSKVVIPIDPLAVPTEEGSMWLSTYDIGDEVVIIPVDPVETPTTNGSMWVETEEPNEEPEEPEEPGDDNPEENPE